MGYHHAMGHQQSDEGPSGTGTPAASLDAESAKAVSRTLQALAAPSRLLILSRLRTEPATVTELTEALGLEQSAVSHQLRLLRMMGLVVSERHGRHITYSLFDQHVAALLDEAVYHAEHLRLNTADQVPARRAATV